MFSVHDICSMSPIATGFVSLVGAGPGDPDLITVRGLRALSRAEVILSDALIAPGFRSLFPATALTLSIGKRCGQASANQLDIHSLMITHAMAGHRVVRLKGGDPLIFGRGGEEARALQDAGIPFEIIPGISAFQGAAASAGIPLTHRRISRRITLMEGHHLPEDPETWRDLARSDGTLVIYMGTRRAPEIAQSLLEHGADPAMPVALMEKACCPDQTTSQQLTTNTRATPSRRWRTAKVTARTRRY